MGLYTYYIAFKKFMNDGTEANSWVVIDTKRDLNCSSDLIEFIKELDEMYGCTVWIINWKELTKTGDYIK